MQDCTDVWARAAAAWHDAQCLKIARLGDKVEAQRRLGYAVNGYSMGELARAVADMDQREIDALAAEYDQRYAGAYRHRPNVGRGPHALLCRLIRK